MESIFQPQALDKLLDERLNALIGARGWTEEAKALFKKTADQEAKFSLAYKVWKGNGFADPRDAGKFTDSKLRDEARMSYGELIDAMSTPDATILMPRVMTQIMKEAIEPQLTLTPLMRVLRASAGTSMTFPSVSAMSGVADLAEGDEYPEMMGPRFAGTVTAKIGKVGCAIRITEEMLRYGQWDIMSMLMQGAGRALARHKEVKVANQILDNGVVSFDNDNPSASTNGRTTGRDINGDLNSTLRLDDLFVTYSDLINDGFLPNTLLVNAAGWLIFARDPMMRVFNFAHGSGPLMRPAQGSNAQPWQGGAAGQEWQEPVTSANLNFKSTLNVPVSSLFPVPLQVVISPHITYTAATKKTNIIMADREELGLMVVDEDLVTDSFDDPTRDIRKVKFRERYGFCILNDGKGIRSLKNISTNRGFDFEDTKASWDVGVTPLPTV